MAYRLLVGEIAALSQRDEALAVAAMAPTGRRRASWLAGRVLLTLALAPRPLPPIELGAQGKPGFAPGSGLWFNLSHSADLIALLLSDEGEVGCDIELLRPHRRADSLATALFTDAERQLLAAAAPELKMATFWRIWTQREAAIKQRGGSVWEMIGEARLQPPAGYVSHLNHPHFSLAVCTPSPFTLQVDHIEYVANA